MVRKIGKNSELQGSDALETVTCIIVYVEGGPPLMLAVLSASGRWKLPEK